MPRIEQGDRGVNHQERRGMTENSADVHIDLLFALRARLVRMNGVGCLRLEGSHCVRQVCKNKEKVRIEQCYY